MGQRTTEVERNEATDLMPEAADHSARNHRKKKAVAPERLEASKAELAQVAPPPLMPMPAPVDTTLSPTSANSIVATNHAPVPEDEENADITATRRHIEETRHQIADTLDAIKDQLSPQHLMAEARETVREVASERVHKAERVIGDAVQTAYKKTEPTLDAASQRLKTVAGQARAVGQGAVAITRRQPLLVGLALCGLALLWFNGRRQPQVRVRH
jgi:small-conductance mechanosensitive channel